MSLLLFADLILVPLLYPNPKNLKAWIIQILLSSLRKTLDFLQLNSKVTKWINFCVDKISRIEILEFSCVQNFANRGVSNISCGQNFTKRGFDSNICDCKSLSYADFRCISRNLKVILQLFSLWKIYFEELNPNSTRLWNFFYFRNTSCKFPKILHGLYFANQQFPNISRGQNFTKMAKIRENRKN